MRALAAVPAYRANWMHALQMMMTGAGALAACAVAQAQATSQLVPEHATRAASQSIAVQAPDRCVTSASRFHSVNENILRAILRVESRMVEQTINRNANGTIDVGLGGTNSVHFPELARHGIAPGHLLDGCVAAYVAAWQLSKHIARYGNNMYGVAAYHSTTAYFNQRYQILVHNELVRMKALPGPIREVPPLRPIAPAPEQESRTLVAQSAGQVAEKPAMVRVQ